ncbi:MAG: hypothetical protein KBC00_02550 [Candidatus Levybacteria bacterium]|nr:hypothetical protein [Candidatus Levybacteria bacterium]MBP9815010.1 hypothetical protein [Candidatus Levybacteria bacterium]
MDSRLTLQEEALYGAATPRNFDEGLFESINVTPQLFDEYQSKIFLSRPDIESLGNTLLGKSFFDVAKSHIRENRNSVIKKRKQELHLVIEKEVARLLGVKIARSVIKQLKGNDSVSSIQHSVPLGHPYILNATFQEALPYFGGSNPNLQNVIVMANSLASFNNYSSPKADALHLLTSDEINNQQFSFFGQTSEAFPTIFHKPYGENAIEEMKKRAINLRQSNKITKENMQNIMDLFEEVYSSPHVLSQGNYLDQLTVLNYYLFKRLMQGYKKQIPNLVFLSQELITLSLLEANHMNTSTILGKIIFNKDYAMTFLEEFDGLNGAFNTQKDTGTFLFWARPKGNEHRERLKLGENELISLNSNYRLELTPEAISDAIKREELIPSTSLVFLVLVFYYGLSLGGGLAQVNNINALKKAYFSFLKKREEGGEDLLVLDSCVADNLVISRPSVLYMQKDLKRIPVTGMDIIVYGKNITNWDKIIESTKQIAITDILTRLYPFYYQQFVENKEDRFVQISEKDIENFKQLSSKIPPLFEV